MNVIVIPEAVQRAPDDLLDFIWTKATHVMATSGVHPPMFLLFGESSVTVFDVRAEIGSTTGKNVIAAMMHMLSREPTTRAIGFVSEAWALLGASGAALARVAEHGVSAEAGCTEILYASVETRAGSIARLAEIVRDEDSIEFRNEQALFGGSAEARFGRFFAAGEA